MSKGINLMGIVCPGGQEVGDWKSGDQMGSGPNASQPERCYLKKPINTLQLRKKGLAIILVTNISLNLN